jgi:hypothetical protein
VQAKRYFAFGARAVKGDHNNFQVFLLLGGFVPFAFLVIDEVLKKSVRRPQNADQYDDRHRV